MAWAEAEALFGLAQTGAEEGVGDGGMGKLGAGDDGSFHGYIFLFHDDEASTLPGYHAKVGDPFWT